MPVTAWGNRCDRCQRFMPGSIYDSTGESIKELLDAGESPLFDCGQHDQDDADLEIETTADVPPRRSRSAKARVVQPEQEVGEHG